MLGNQSCPDCNLAYFYIIHTDCGLVSARSFGQLRLNSEDTKAWTMQFPLDAIIQRVVGERTIIPAPLTIYDIVQSDLCHAWNLEEVRTYRDPDERTIERTYYLCNSELACDGIAALVERPSDLLLDEETTITLKYEDQNLSLIHI